MKSTIAGILMVLGGVFGLVRVISLYFFEWVKTSPGLSETISIVLIATSIIAITGGIFSFAKRLWGLGILGAMASLFSFSLMTEHFFVAGIASVISFFIRFLGIAAIILIISAKNEFNRRSKVED